VPSTSSGRVGLSIDLVSTSETNVTVSLDAGANLLDEGVLDKLLTVTLHLLPGLACCAPVLR
jgi:hypothetical protein